ncbi:MAG: OadG family protein [Pseudomonadota bacterium]
MSSTWEPSVELMLMGMGTVFVFLTLLVLGMIIMSNIAQRIGTKEQQANSARHSNNTDIAVVAAAAYAASKK